MHPHLTLEVAVLFDAGFQQYSLFLNLYAESTCFLSWTASYPDMESALVAARDKYELYDHMYRNAIEHSDTPVLEHQFGQLKMF